MLKKTHIRAVFRKPIKTPVWWEGHVIRYKEYPFGVGAGKNGFCTLKLSSRDASHQKHAPYNIGDFLTVSIGGKRVRGQISDVDIYRPGWPEAFDPDKDAGEWKITLDFPRIPASQA